MSKRKWRYTIYYGELSEEVTLEISPNEIHKQMINGDIIKVIDDNNDVVKIINWGKVACVDVEEEY